MLPASGNITNLLGTWKPLHLVDNIHWICQQLLSPARKAQLFPAPVLPPCQISQMNRCNQVSCFKVYFAEARWSNLDQTMIALCGTSHRCFARKICPSTEVISTACMSTRFWDMILWCKQHELMCTQDPGSWFRDKRAYLQVCKGACMSTWLECDFVGGCLLVCSVPAYIVFAV